MYEYKGIFVYIYNKTLLCQRGHICIWSQFRLPPHPLGSRLVVVYFPWGWTPFLGRYLPGFILIVWELVVNNLSNLNMGIVLSMLGRFEEAKAVINEEWVLLYMASDL